MLNRMSGNWIFLVVLCAFSVGTTSTEEHGYLVARTFTLQRELNGVDGKLVLLLDQRLTDSVRDDLWGKGDWSFVLPPDSDLFKTFSKSPPRNALLRIESNDGKVILERILDRPLAKLEAWDSNSPSNHSYLLTVDYSTGAGSYNGPNSTLFRISGGTFHDTEAVNVADHRKKQIHLTKSLKSDWRFAKEGGRTEILAFSCHPTEGHAFVLDYARYMFDGTEWLVFKRSEPGMWESDKEFPPRSLFP